MDVVQGVLEIVAGFLEIAAGFLEVKLLEIGMITPPVGLNVFVIRNVASEYVSVLQIFKGVIPFLIADIVVVAICIAFPALILFLPGFL